MSKTEKARITEKLKGITTHSIDVKKRSELILKKFVPMNW